jgi:hypothetical protein
LKIQKKKKEKEKKEKKKKKILKIYLKIWWKRTKKIAWRAFQGIQHSAALHGRE